MNKDKIRNFSIIAHIDHGKTTLTDRLLQITQTVSERDLSERLLDSNPIEKERGITIKLAPVTMKYALEDQEYLLNLIDTPGHVDFSYEVERSLAACEAAVLLIDATQGVQAQTVAHAYKAVDANLHLIPVLNKIDLPSANVPQAKIELQNMFGFREDEISFVSAKTGEGVDTLLQRVIKESPSPKGNQTEPLRALVFNSTYDPHLGVIAFVRIVDGNLDKSQGLKLMQSQKILDVKEIGIFTPHRYQIGTLQTGTVGYIATGLKDIRDLKVGDTIIEQRVVPQSLLPLPGYQEAKHTVYADVYPAEDYDYEELVTAVEKLQLSDAALSSKPVHSTALGSGFRLGFLGLFHVEITKERLLREQGVETVVTNPTVEYTVTTTDGVTEVIHNPNDLPDPSNIALIKEPITKATILTPADYQGNIMQLMERHRGTYLDTHYLGDRVQLTYKVPLAELITGTFDELKSVSQGYATLDYEFMEPEPVDAAKLTILLNGEEVPPLARIVVKSQADQIGRKLVKEIKELLPHHLFAVPIQAAIGARIVARETKSAMRKDVTAKLYGGDQTRKDKLLKKQKKGKKRMAEFGKVSIPDTLYTKLATM